MRRLSRWIIAKTRTERTAVKLRLEDEGSGWFWDHPVVEVEVTAQRWGHSRLYYKVRPCPPFEREEPTPGGQSRAAFRSAWISPRWVGHEIEAGHDTSVFVWLVGEEGDREPPPSDSPPSARVRCRIVG
jgi:hypothetical protein